MAQQSPMPPSSLSRLVVPAASGSHFTCCNDHYTSLPARRDRHSRTPSAPMPYVGDIERHGACLSDLESIYTRRGLSWTETDKTCGELRAAASGAAEADPQPGLATDDPRAVATGLGEERGASGHWPGERAPAQCDVEQGSASVMLRPAAKKHKKRLIIKKHRVCHEDRIDFVMIAAEGFITFGAPAHRFETLTKAASKVLELEATFLVFPGSFVGFFEDPARKNTHIQRTIYCTSSLVLGKLQRVYDVYWEVCHDRCSAIDGTMRIKAILRGGSEYNAVIQTALFFLLGAFITPLAFGGSFIDAVVAGIVSAVISFVQRLFASISSGMTPIKVITVIIVSFAARMLSSVTDGRVCYNAVASGGIVTLLPGFLVLSASLEIASKSMVSGSAKMTWAVVYSMLLGFALQAGSSIYLWVDPVHKLYVDSLAAEAAPEIEMIGVYEVVATNWNVPLQGAISFTPKRSSLVDASWKAGCFRPEGTPWFALAATPVHLFWLVPAFALVNILCAGQHLRRWDTLAMLVIACVSFVVNRYADLLILQRGHVVSLVGATICGILGCAYTRLQRGKHLAPFVVMAPGILFLLPSGLAIAGGITAEVDVVSLGNSLVLVSIGIACGILLSQGLVFMFGGGKRSLTLSF